MSRVETFERIWRAVEEANSVPNSVAARSAPGGRTAAALKTAGALRAAAAKLPAPDLETAWRGLTPRLTPQPQPGLVSTSAGPQDARVYSFGAAARSAARRRSHLRTSLRVAAAAAAVIVAVATVSLHAGPGSRLYPLRLTVERAALALSPNDAGLQLRVARARLGDLVSVLEDGPADLAPDVARALVLDRQKADSAGADVSVLDRDIASQVPPALARVDAGIAGQVRSILGDLLPSPVPSMGAPGQLVPSPGADQGSGESGDGDTGRTGGGSTEGGDTKGDPSSTDSSDTGGSGSTQGSDGADGSGSTEGPGSGESTSTSPDGSTG
jgi:hypothetical protein